METNFSTVVCRVVIRFHINKFHAPLSYVRVGIYVWIEIVVAGYWLVQQMQHCCMLKRHCYYGYYYAQRRTTKATNMTSPDPAHIVQNVRTYRAPQTAAKYARSKIDGTLQQSLSLSSNER